MADGLQSMCHATSRAQLQEFRRGMQPAAASGGTAAGNSGSRASRCLTWHLARMHHRRRQFIPHVSLVYVILAPVYGTRGSISKGRGIASRIRLNSGCAGFNRKFHSAALIAEGTWSTALDCRLSQSVPMRCVSTGYGANRRQLSGSPAILITSIDTLSGMSASPYTNRGIWRRSEMCTNTSSCASDSDCAA